MNVELDPIIDFFIKDNFTQFMGDEIRQAFTLFDEFGIVSYDHPFLGLLPLQSISDPGETIANFLALLNDQLDYILIVHGIELINQTPIIYKNTILKAIINYIGVLPEFRLILNNYVDDDELTNEEKFATFVSHFSDMSMTGTLPVLENVSSDLIDKIANLIDHEDTILVSNDKSVNLYKLFKIFITEYNNKISFTLADSIILSSFPLGLPLGDYLPFCHSMLVKLEPDVLSLNLFSLYVISENYLNGDFENVYSAFEEYYAKVEQHIDIRESFLSLSNQFAAFISENNKDISNE